MTIDEQLTLRYQRAFDCIKTLPIGDRIVDLIIQVAKDIKTEEDALKRKTDKTDVGGFYDKEEQERIDAEKRREQEEDEAWGELAPSMNLPMEEKKDVSA